MREFLPLIVGFALGALVVTVGLRQPGTGTQAFVEPETAATTPASRESVARPEEEPTAGSAIAASPRPPAFGINSRIHEIVGLGASDPAAAIAAAAALPEHAQRRLALLRLAPALAAADPLGALAASEGITAPDLEKDFVEALLETWVSLDPAAVFAWLESGELSRVPPTADTLAALASRDAERLLDISEDLRRDVARSAASAALRFMMRQDARDALTRIDQLPLGNVRTILTSAAITALSEQDPEAAAAWATATQASARTWFGIINGALKVDPDLGWEIMLSQWNSPDSSVHDNVRDLLTNFAYAVVGSESIDEITRGLDRLVSLGDPEFALATGVTLRNWANDKPLDALEWTLANLDNINAEYVLTGLSSGLARDDFELARQTLLRLDEEHVGAWSAGVTQELARNDLGAARAWTFEFPSGPARDAGLHEVISAEAQGGTVDRQLFEMFDSDSARDEAASLAATRLGCAGQTELAREIATAYIANERQRDQAMRIIERRPLIEGQSVSIECQMIEVQ